MPARPPRPVRLRPELLEHRVVPAAYTVNDGGDDPLDASGNHGPGQTENGTVTLRSALEQVDLDGEPGDVTFAVPGVTTTGVSSTSQVTLQGNPTGNGPGGTQITGGVAVGASSIVSDLFVTGATQTGLRVGAGSTVTECLVSGNGGDGIDGAAVTVTGCYVGTTADGTAAQANAGYGIAASGTCTVRDCVVSANGRTGVWLTGGGGGSTIAGCMIGTDKTGRTALGNGRSGIWVFGSDDNVIGGTTAADRNVVSGNKDGGIVYPDCGVVSHDNVIRGNYVGVDATGGTALPNNGTAGIIAVDVSGLVIGGPDAADRNVVSGNTRSGIQLNSDGAFPCENNRIVGNSVGTDATGRVPIPNGSDGVDVFNCINTTVGGSGAGNVIAANGDYGVTLLSSNRTLIQGNDIGTDATETADLGNGRGGITITSSNQTTIGAPVGSEDPALGNAVAFNGDELDLQGHGVEVGSGTGNTVRLNSIFKNRGLGIEVGDNSWDRYNPDAFGTGANDSQYHPTVVSVDGATVDWMLNARPNQTYTIDLYADPENQQTSYAEGQTHLQTLTALTDATGHAEFTTAVGSEDTDRMTATATDANGNTSEFSLVDSSGDGLADVWKTTGIDLNLTGTPDLTLPGATVGRKDLYVQYDAMVGWGPVAGALADVQAVFAAHDITLHLTADNLAVPTAGFGSTPWVPFQAVKQADFAGGAGPGSNAYTANLLAYRFCVFGQTYGNAANPVLNSSGLSEIIGNDFMVTLGTIPLTPATTRAAQAGTFLHEFGHTLGLGHFGPVRWDGMTPRFPGFNNGDPNYHSVMNYFYQGPGIGFTNPTTGVFGAGPPILDYSEPAFGLNEWDNLWFPFQENRQSLSGGGDTTTASPDDDDTEAPAFDPSQADLVVLGPAASDSTIAVGAATPVTFTVSNLGPATAAATAFTLTVPDGVTIGAVTASQGTATVSGNTITVAVGDLGSLSDATVTVELTPAANGSFALIGTATTTTTDGAPGDNTSTVSLTPSGTASPPASPPATPPPPGSPPSPPVPPTSPPSPPVSPLPSGGPLPALVGATRFAVGPDAGGDGVVTVYNADGSVAYTVTPFPGFTGGVRVAVADLNGDGVPDLIAATGPGVGNQVVLVDGKTQQIIASLTPFESTFTGGLFVAVGDVTGDGVPDLVVTPDESGGPVVVIYNGAALGAGTVDQVARFFGIDDPNFRGGARAALGDVSGDGVADLIVSAGFGGGPRVAVYDGRSVAANAPTALLPDFFAFESTLRNGVYVTAGGLTGGGYADLVFGAGPGGGPRVRAVDPKPLLAAAGNFASLDDPAVSGAAVADFFAGDASGRGGVRVAVADLDGDARADLVAGAGTGAGSRVTAYPGATLAGTPAPSLDFDAVPGFAGGVFVG